jgi:hypothetical protein
MTINEFFQIHAQEAKRSGQKYSLNPSVILAVSSWETAFGTSYAYKNDRNCFGIKSGVQSPHWDGVSKRATTDGGYYRRYAITQDSFYDFGWLISSVSRYAGIKNLSNDPNAFAEGFITTGYMGGTQTQRNNYRDAIIDRAAKFASLYGNQPVDNEFNFTDIAVFSLIGIGIFYTIKPNN